MRVAVLVLLVLGTAACGRLASLTDGAGGGRVTFDGLRFSTSLSVVSEDRREMAITVRPVAVNPEAALEAGRYEATKYCLRNFGGSHTEWDAGPDQPIGTLQVVEDTVTLRGRCTERA